MPLDGGGTASKPAGTTAVAGTTIESSKFNSVIDDIYAILNTARPIAYGGTGSGSASGARTALGLAIGSDVQAHDAALASLAGLALEAGDILYATAADALARLGKGTDGQALMLASGVPVWDDLPASGGMTIVYSETVTSGSTWTLTDIPAGYKDLQVVLSGLSFNNGSAALVLEYSVDNGSNWSVPVTLTATLGTQSDTFDGPFFIYQAGRSGIYKTIVSEIGDSGDSTTTIRHKSLSALNGAVNAIRLSGGTFDGGFGRVEVRTLN